MLRYAITDRRLFPGNEFGAHKAALVSQAERLAATHAAHFLQLREKDLPLAQLRALARRIVVAARTPPPSTVPAVPLLSGQPRLPAGPLPARSLQILLNGPATLAAEVHADGLHLPSTAGLRDLDQARELFHLAGLPPPILSISCHTVAEVQTRAREGFDLLLFGPVYEKRVRGQLVTPGLGLSALEHAARLAGQAKLLALGGVTEANAPLCMEAGAAGIAAIRLFL